MRKLKDIKFSETSRERIAEPIDTALIDLSSSTPSSIQVEDRNMLKCDADRGMIKYPKKSKLKLLNSTGDTDTILNALRNFSLLHDSSFIEKLLGFHRLINKFDDIIQYLKTIETQFIKHAAGLKNPRVKFYLIDFSKKIKQYITKINSKLEYFNDKFGSHIKLLEQENGQEIISTAMASKDFAANTSAFSKDGAPSRTLKVASTQRPRLGLDLEKQQISLTLPDSRYKKLIYLLKFCNYSPPSLRAQAKQSSAMLVRIIELDCFACARNDAALDLMRM